MKIVLIGATGMVGSRIMNELLLRGHAVTAVVRSPDKLPQRPGLSVVAGDVFDTDRLAQQIAGHDAVIQAYKPLRTHPDRTGEQRRATQSVVSAVKSAGVLRVLAVAGCGTLEVAPGVKYMNAPEFPQQWMGGAISTAEVTKVLSEHPELEWTTLSPSHLIEPGERTAKFRLGTDQLLRNEKGESRISAEDYAVAMVDELEQPKHIRGRFTVAN